MTIVLNFRAFDFDRLMSIVLGTMVWGVMWFMTGFLFLLPFMGLTASLVDWGYLPLWAGAKDWMMPVAIFLGSCAYTLVGIVTFITWWCGKTLASCWRARRKA